MVRNKNERGEWKRPEPVAGELNTDVDEGTPSFTPDGLTMYLSRARREPNAHTGVEIYTSQRSDASWSAPVLFEITADTLSSYAHPQCRPTACGSISHPTCPAAAEAATCGA